MTPEHPLKVLVVEDETILALQLKLSLQRFGFSISGIKAKGEEAILHAKEHSPDLILMDIHLQGNLQGTQAGALIWERYRIPIIFLTSYCDDKTLKEAMACEPYGYLIKPFREGELKATLQAAWNKHCRLLQHSKESTKAPTALGFGYAFDSLGAQLLWEGKAIKLTGNEIRFFEILSERPGHTVSFEVLLDLIWGESHADPTRLRNLVYRLRQKLHPALIENVFEAGYRLHV